MALLAVVLMMYVILVSENVRRKYERCYLSSYADGAVEDKSRYFPVCGNTHSGSARKRHRSRLSRRSKSRAAETTKPAQWRALSEFLMVPGGGTLTPVMTRAAGQLS